LALAFALERVLSRGTPGQQEEAIGYCRVCLGIRPDHAASLINLGARLLAKGDSDGAVTWSRKATEMAPQRAEGHFNLGVSLYAKKDLEGAIASYRKALELEPALSRAFTNLGVIWMEKAEAEPARGDEFRAEAIQCYRKAIETNAKDHNAQINLGYALKADGELAGAVACFRKVTQLKPKDAIAWCDLGLCLRGQGQFAEAIDAFQRGHEIGHSDPAFHVRSRKWLDECENLREVDRRLKQVLAGDATPASAIECVELATFCTLYGQRFADAIRLYDQAIRRDQRLAMVVRYRKACAAVRAANGDGVDAPKVDERSILRKQALGWVRDDLALWQKTFPLAPRNLQHQMLKMLTLRLNEADLASVRSTSALAKLPDSERLAWQTYWNDLRRTVRDNSK
jgi:tetratricopeptide (TPR) repeat protein